MELPYAIEELTFPVQGLLDYWNALPRHEDLPHKSSLDPSHIPLNILPHIFLLELEYQPFAAFFRLQGTYINFALEQHFTGQYIDHTTFGESAEEILRSYEKVTKNRAAYVSHQEISSSGSQTLLLEAVHLPLVDDDNQVKFILGALFRLSDSNFPKPGFVASRWEIKARRKIS